MHVGGLIDCDICANKSFNLVRECLGFQGGAT